LCEKVGPDALPEDHVDLYAELEPLARNGACVKPITALDLMLHARKGPYQSTMDRKDIKIKRVPVALAQKLCDELNTRMPLKDIYFARQSDKKKRWHTVQIKVPGKDEYERDFVHVVLKFRPSSALKALVVDAGIAKENATLLFSEVGVKAKYRPLEYGWAPFAKAISTKEEGWWSTIKVKGQKKKGRAWPGVIRHHIDHWAFDTLAVRYSIDDVIYVKELYKYFECPEPGDEDSILACMVGSVRWRGFGVNLEKVVQLREESLRLSKAAPKHSTHVLRYLSEVMSPTEVVGLNGSTKKVVLEMVSKWTNDDGSRHPAAIRAEACLLARKSRTDYTLFDKLLIAKKFHVSLKVIGALSSRMSGADGLNATGIQHQKKIRSAFTLASGDLVLTGGDFAAYEIGIADARYNDPKLRKQLLTCYVCKEPRKAEQYDDVYCPNCGAAQTKCKNCKQTCLTYKDSRITCGCAKPEAGGLEDTMRKIHGLFAMQLYPGMSYEEIYATKGSVEDKYDYGKRGVFSQLYGGNFSTLMNRLGIPEEQAKNAEIGFATEYEGIGQSKKEIYDKFCSMRQPGGIGSVVYWSEPAEYAESLNGFRRYFTLENNICRILFQLANEPPEDWNKIKIECVRRDRTQKVGGAVKSAVFAAAFQIQSHNMRAATNHEIQSTGVIEACTVEILPPVSPSISREKNSSGKFFVRIANAKRKYPSDVPSIEMSNTGLRPYLSDNVPSIGAAKNIAIGYIAESNPSKIKPKCCCDGSSRNAPELGSPKSCGITGMSTPIPIMSIRIVRYKNQIFLGIKIKSPEAFCFITITFYFNI
jgi:predicted RNA-binding Zn-ribbon protein involved in translation (DUF1610 family)